MIIVEIKCNDKACGCDKRWTWDNSIPDEMMPNNLTIEKLFEEVEQFQKKILPPNVLFRCYKVGA